MQLKKSPQSKQGDLSLLAQDAFFDGEIVFSGTFRVNGKIKGDVAATEQENSFLVINKGAEIEGNLKAGTVFINGLVKGNIEALHSISLLRNGNLEGNIKTGEFLIESGAKFNGECQMHQEK